MCLCVKTRTPILGCLEPFSATPPLGLTSRRDKTILFLRRKTTDRLNPPSVSFPKRVFHPRRTIPHTKVTPLSSSCLTIPQRRGGSPGGRGPSGVSHLQTSPRDAFLLPQPPLICPPAHLPTCSPIHPTAPRNPSLASFDSIICGFKKDKESLTLGRRAGGENKSIYVMYN